MHSQTTKKPHPAGVTAYQNTHAHFTANLHQQVREAMLSAGLQPPADIQFDGELHRFSSSGKRSDKNGYYKLYGDPPLAAGYFGCWKTGITSKWRADIGRDLTDDEVREHSRRMAVLQQEREAEEQIKHQAAAANARKLWRAATPAEEAHPYIQLKRIKPHDARVAKNGDLLVSMIDADGAIWNLEQITVSSDGSNKKRGLTGGRRTGLFHVIGEINQDSVICVVEGFATGCSIHEATEHACVVAFNCGNLPAVAQAIRQKYPDHQIIIAADDDYMTDGNPGLTKAKEAAASGCAIVGIPTFASDRPEKATDFNDMVIHCGVEAVQNYFLGLIKSGVTGVTGVQANEYNTSPVTPDHFEGVTGVTNPETEQKNAIPDEKKRPCFRVIDEWIDHGNDKYKPGVWYFGIKQNTDAPILTRTWICGQLHIDAVTCDAHGNNFGRLLRFKNTLEKWRIWAMPMHLLKGSGDELRGELLSMGLEIDQANRFKLGEYLQDRPPERRITCVKQAGWIDEGNFALPNAIYGANAANFVYQSESAHSNEYNRSGTLQGWRDGVAALAVGNPLILTAVSAAFAGALLKLCGVESGGIHYYGRSSTGKTSTADAACSVWGGSGYRRSWKSTANGLEGVSQLFSDSLLVLDEIGQCEPRDVGEIVYMIGNGRGKQRAARTGSAREIATWRCMVVSTGEMTGETKMQEGGFRIQAGQEMRLLNIPANRTYGAFDELHGAADGAAFSETIRRSALQHYGHAGAAYLERLTHNTAEISPAFQQIKESFKTDGSGQVSRAAARFAVIALAGELATDYGITGWTAGTATEAAKVCFDAWKSARGHTGQGEDVKILDAIQTFIDRHKDSRFSSVQDAGLKVIDRAGYWKPDGEGRIYLFNTHAFKEATRGFDRNTAVAVLRNAGVMDEAGSDGKSATLHRIGGESGRYYAIRSSKLEA